MNKEDYKKAAIEFLDTQNTKFPDRSVEKIKELYFKEFPDRNFYYDVDSLTQIKNTGVYKNYTFLLHFYSKAIIIDF